MKNAKLSTAICNLPWVCLITLSTSEEERKNKPFNTEQKSLRCQPSYRLSRILLHYPIILCLLYQAGVSTDTTPVTDSFGHVRLGMYTTELQSTRANFHGSLPPDPLRRKVTCGLFCGRSHQSYCRFEAAYGKHY